MADHKTVRLESKQLAALSDMAEGDEADNESEALRAALNVGLSELGYYNGTGDPDGAIKHLARRFADAFALVGLILVGLTYWYPLGLRMVVAAPFAASIACYTLVRVLDAYELGVSERIQRLFPGGERA